MSARLSTPWIIKYRPKKVGDVVDQDQAKQLFIPWLKKWLSGNTPDKKAALLYGPAGVGKTSLVEAAAREYGLELIEMNASDFRRKEDIERIAKVAATQSSLFGRRRIILLDEVDGITGTADRGGLEAILELIKVAKQPIVMTANDPWDQKLRPLRDASLLIPFNRLGERHVISLLEKICKSEGVYCESDALKLIAQRCEGDLRSAINDLQAVAEGFGKVTVESVQAAVSYRDRQYSPWEMLRNLFMSRYIWQARRAVTHVDMDYETLLQWLNENVPIQYSDPEDVAMAFEALSRADIYMARIKRTQSWDLLSYFFDMVGPAVMLARRYSKFRWVKYQYPQKIVLMARTREVREVREALASMLSARLLLSKSRAKSEVVPFLMVIFHANPEYAARIAIGYGMSESMIRYLAGPKASEVIRIVNEMKLGVAAVRPRGAPSGAKRDYTERGGSKRRR
ncbi:MAG: replication factor C large subunit [Thermoproteota archaeon]